MAKKVSKFSQHYARLEEIAQTVEREEVDLEKSLALYKEAAELVKKLKKRLKAIENEIEEVRTGLEGEIDSEE